MIRLLPEALIPANWPTIEAARAALAARDAARLARAPPEAEPPGIDAFLTVRGDARRGGAAAGGDDGRRRARINGVDVPIAPPSARVKSMVVRERVSVGYDLVRVGNFREVQIMQNTSFVSRIKKRPSSNHRAS